MLHYRRLFHSKLSNLYKFGRSRFLQFSIHFLVLYNFAVLLPFIQSLQLEPMFLVYKGIDSLDVALILLAICIPAPLILIVIEWLLFKRNQKLYFIVHSILNGLFIMLILLPPLNYQLPGGASILLSFLAGASFSWSYHNFSIPRLYLNILSPVIIAFPLMYLFFSPAEQLLPPLFSHSDKHPKLSNPLPVVVIILDELPLMTLLNENGNIDSRQFPNFSNLAKHSYFFENSYAVAGYTNLSLPTILTGNCPNNNKLSIYNNYPKSIFSLLQKDYQIIAEENWTKLCPTSTCKSLSYNFSRWERIYSTIYYGIGIKLGKSILPANLSFSPDSKNPTDTVTKIVWPEADTIVTTRNPVKKRDKWNLFKPNDKLLIEVDQRIIYSQFIESAKNAKQPTFYFLHLVLPHKPFVHLPDGRLYLLQEKYGLHQRSDDPAQAIVDYQRHMLQAQFTDKLLGQFFSLLKRQNLYDQSLIIVTADHGISFEPNSNMRKVNQKNLEEILRVPLFVKLPKQKLAVKDSILAQHIDIFPTVQQIIGCKNCWTTEGKSLFTLLNRGRQSLHHVPLKAKMGQDHIKIQHSSAPLTELAKVKFSRLARSSEGFLVPKTPYNHLLNQTVSNTSFDVHNDIYVTVHTPRYLYEQVNISGNFLPVLYNGTIYTKKPINRPIRLAVALNGRISAISITFKPHQFYQANFSLMLPPSLFKTGVNKIRIFEIMGPKSTPILKEIQDIR